MHDIYHCHYSEQPVVLFSRLHNVEDKKQDGGMYLRHDYVLLDKEGHIEHPTISEVQGLIHSKYNLVHGRDVPFRPPLNATYTS